MTPTGSPAANESRLPAYKQVALAVRRQILDGDIAAGERLMGENELAARFGVSRSTIREAVRTLEAQHLVTTHRGVAGGVFVVHPAASDVEDVLTEQLGLLSNSRTFDMESILEARDLLEAPAAQLAAARRSTDHVRQLRRCLDEPNAPGPAGLSLGEHFHVVILDATGNALLGVMTRPIYVVLREKFRQHPEPDGFQSMVDRDHARIHEVIAAGDGDGAEREMRAHLRNLAIACRSIEPAPLVTDPRT